MPTIITIIYGLTAGTFIAWGISIFTKGLGDKNQDEIESLLTEIKIADKMLEEKFGEKEITKNGEAIQIRDQINRIFEDTLLIAELNKKSCLLKLWRVHQEIQTLDKELIGITDEIQSQNNHGTFSIILT